MSKTVNIRPHTNSSPTTEGGATVTNPSYAYDRDRTTRAEFNSSNTLTTTSSAYVYYNFSISSVPQDAEIIGINLYAVARVNSNTNIGSSRNFRIGLYDGTTAITANKINVTGASGSGTIYNVALTNNELISFLASTDKRVRVRVYKNGSSKYTQIKGSLYEIYIIVTYELNGVTFKTKINGTWEEATPLVKVNGSWEEVTNAFVKVNGSWETV